MRTRGMSSCVDTAGRPNRRMAVLECAFKPRDVQIVLACSVLVARQPVVTPPFFPFPLARGAVRPACSCPLEEVQGAARRGGAKRNVAATLANGAFVRQRSGRGGARAIVSKSTFCAQVWYCALHNRPWLASAHTVLETRVVLSHIAENAKPIYEESSTSHCADELQHASSTRKRRRANKKTGTR